MSNQNSTQANELSLNEVLQIRRDKLSELQASGNNPYAVTKVRLYRLCAKHKG